MIEYFADNLWQMWTLIAIVCLIVELTNGDFYVMCFSIGALLTVLVSLFVPGFSSAAFPVFGCFRCCAYSLCVRLP